MADHAHVVHIRRSSPSPGREADAEAALRREAEVAAGADGCFGAQLCRQEGTDVLATISRWQDRASLDAFLGQGRQAEEQGQDLFQSESTEDFTSV